MKTTPIETPAQVADAARKSVESGCAGEQLDGFDTLRESLATLATEMRSTS